MGLTDSHKTVEISPIGGEIDTLKPIVVKKGDLEKIMVTAVELYKSLAVKAITPLRPLKQCAAQKTMN